MNKASIRKKVMKEMKQIYYDDNKPYIDWMGYEINEDNYPTYHHIEKREDLIKDNKDIDATVENGAYLGLFSHQKLHEIEKIDKDLYYSWNHLFSIINNMRCYPIDDSLKLIYNLKKITEELLENNKNIVK